MHTERTMGKILRAFAEAAEAGEFEAAEGWIAVAAWVRDRSEVRRLAPATR
jgi:hypothetical protein